MSRRILIPRSPAIQINSDDSDIDDVSMSSPIFRSSASPPAQRLVAPAQTPVLVSGASTASPAGQASRARSTVPSSPAANFIQEHTLLDSNVSVLEECPICLDTYTSERCVRIAGIPGCTHRIGKECLKNILRNKPGDEKKCPMCRSVWIKRSVPSTREQERARDPNEVNHAISQSLLAADEHGRAPVKSRAGGRDLGSSDRWFSAPRPTPQPSARHQTQPLPSTLSRVVNLESDSHDDKAENAANVKVYTALFGEYKTLARDSEALRDRAIEASDLFNQRRREMREASARQRASSRPGGANPTPNSRPVGAGPTSVRDARPVGAVGDKRSLSPLANPFRPTGNDNSRVPQRSAKMGHPSNKPRVQSTQERHISQAFANTRPPSAPIASSLVPNGTHSPAPPRLPNPSHNSLRALDQRDSHLRKTQLHLAQRERDLDVRQARLLEREASLAAREKRVLEREKRAEKVLATTKRHGDELEMMMKRQRVETENVMR